MAPRAPVRSAAAAATPAAKLTSPAGPTAGFRPTEPGRYTLRFTAGGVSDQVTLDALPRNRLVPVDTMATESGAPGIRVGDKTYLLRDAIPNYNPGEQPSTYLQTVLLRPQDASRSCRTGGYPARSVHPAGPAVASS